MIGLQMKTPGVAVAAATQAHMHSVDTPIIGDAEDKLKAIQITRAAKAGVCVFEMGSGGFAVGMSAREVPDLRALQRLLSHMGAPT